MQEIFTYYNADGTLNHRDVVEVPDPSPTPDLPTIADQVTQLTDAVNLLILNSLGV